MYKKNNGCPIGDNFTQIFSQLVMYTFAVRYKNRLINLSLYQQTVLFKIYVDDHNQAGQCLPYGTMYHKGKLYIPKVSWRGRFNKGYKIDDNLKFDIEQRAEQMFMTQYTKYDREHWSATVYGDIANDCVPTSVHMKVDIPDAYDNGKLPILDTEVYISNGHIVHNHFMKPMASLEVVNKISSISMGAKLNILTQEASIIIHNMNLELPWTDTVDHPNNLMIRI